MTTTPIPMTTTETTPIRSQGAPEMPTLTRSEATPSPTGHELAPRTSFARSTYVELRKMVDTRAGFWTLALMALSLVSLVVGVAVWSDNFDMGYSGWINLAVMPQGIFLSIIGILAATSEWTQRTGLVTFALEPRRGRVVLAKAAAATVLAVALSALGLAVAAATYAVTLAANGGTADWALSGQMLTGTAISQVTSLLIGLGFGFMLMNTPLAIAAVFGIPFALTPLSMFLPPLADAMPWIETSSSVSRLVAGTLEGSGWGQLATSHLIWVVLPLAIGTWRVLRSEIK